MADTDFRTPAAAPIVEDKGDMGFGAVVSAQSTTRLLNKDGTFNVRRRGRHWWESHSAYHHALAMTWPRFLWSVVAIYTGLNLLFATLFMLCGESSLVGAAPQSMGGDFGRAFFFSVETFATIGYGNVSPVGVTAHLLMYVESIVAIMSQALITGLLFARFSRPTAGIRFSTNMVVAPFKGGRGLMFRITNLRDNQLIDLRARVNASWMHKDSLTIGRRFQLLQLERSEVMLFPLAWTLVHPITEESPLYGLSDAELRAAAYEFIVLITGTDETFASEVHARSSYRADEIVWGAKFKNIFNPPDADGNLSVDVHRLDEYDNVPLPA